MNTDVPSVNWWREGVHFDAVLVVVSSEILNKNHQSTTAFNIQSRLTTIYPESCLSEENCMLLLSDKKKKKDEGLLVLIELIRKDRKGLCVGSSHIKHALA